MKFNTPIISYSQSPVLGILPEFKIPNGLPQLEADAMDEIITDMFKEELAERCNISKVLLKNLQNTNVDFSGEIDKLWGNTDT